MEISEIKEKEMEERPTFSDRSDFEHSVFHNLFNLGYDVRPLNKCPFDAVTSDDKILLLTGLEENKVRLKRKAAAVFSISIVAEKESVIFVKTINN